MCLSVCFWRTAAQKRTETGKQAPWDVDDCVPVANAELIMNDNVGGSSLKGREENVGITMEAHWWSAVENFSSYPWCQVVFFGCMNWEGKKRSSILFFSPLKKWKTRHCEKLFKRGLLKILPAYNKAEPWLLSGRVKNKGLLWCRCESCGWKPCERKVYGRAE